MNRIYKYPLKVQAEPFTLSLPPGFRILHLNTQAGWPYIWAEVNPALEAASVTFFMGNYVWHYYMEP